MPTYISLMKYTTQGLANIKDAPQRVEAAKAGIKALGGELKEVYLTMGQYDLVGITELPNDEAAAKLALMLGSQGNLSTQTLRAFSSGEMVKIVGELP